MRELVEAFASSGVCCTVIYPWKLHQWIRERRKEVARDALDQDLIKVLRPLTLSLSNRRLISFNTFEITYAGFRRAVWRALKSIGSKPDALYGHFMYPAGASAVQIGQRLDCPAFVAVGEGTFWTLQPLGLKRAKRDLEAASGVIAVSTILRERLIESLALPSTKVGMFPNGIDLKKFYARDRLAMRRKYQLPTNRFLVGYVGNFIKAKGVTRVAEAIDQLEGVSGVFVGSGPLTPKGANVAFCGRLPHDQVPEVLSAVDCFALPSDVEGSSNATLEAMACSLPVVVSARSFNDDICDKTCGFLVEPTNLTAIRHAITELKRDAELRRRFSNAASSRAANFDIRARAGRILAWMTEKNSARPGTPAHRHLEKFASQAMHPLAGDTPTYKLPDSAHSHPL